MSTEDNETWRDESSNDNADRDGNRDFNREGGYNRQNENRPYNRDGNYNRDGARPRTYGDRQQSYGDRQQRPSYNRYDNNDRQGYNSRPQQPRSYNREDGGGERTYRPRINRDQQQQGERVYRPRINNNDGENRGGYNRFDRPQQQRSYNNRDGNNNRPTWRNNNEERKPWQGNTDRRPTGGGNYGNSSYNNRGGDDRQRRPRFTPGGGGGGYNNNYRQQGGGYQQRPFRRTDDYDPNAKYTKKKQIEYKEQFVDPNEPIRLNKYLANAGVCSRREADEFITAGVVSVNGEVVNELGTKIKRSDSVKFHDQPVSVERKVYILLNKPKDCVTTSDDPQSRLTVMDLVKEACEERIYPVGRLDRNTTGVLLLTNDGDLASKLTHPQYLKKKIYHVQTDKNVTKTDMDQILAGVKLDEETEIKADDISYTDEVKRNMIGIEIHSGQNRVVRRIFEALGYKVVRLDRVYFAGLTKKGLRRGDWRYLTENEVSFLRMGSFT